MLFCCYSVLGTKERKIPHPTSHPMTHLFRFVSCPNYTYEVSYTCTRKLISQTPKISRSHNAPPLQRDVWLYQAPSTRIRIFSKTEIFFSVCPSRPHVNGVFGHKYGGFWKRSPDCRFLKTEIYRIRVDGRKLRFSNTLYDDVKVRVQWFSRAYAYHSAHALVTCACSICEV